jgi:Tol biopolymer transport system component
VAFGSFDPLESRNHVALAQTNGGAPRRFTFSRGNQYSPIWAPDASRIAFSDDHQGVDTLSAKPLGGTSNERALIPKPPSSTYAQSWSPDGQHILYRVQSTDGGYDVNALHLPSGKTFLCIGGSGDQSQAQFSPDGGWIAYTSTESGRLEVYVQPFPPTGAKWLVSLGGGEQPRWRGDGRELFYLAPDRKLMSVRIPIPGAFDAEAPQPLFETWIPFGDINVSQVYDVSANGERFLIAAPDPLSPPSAITVAVE